MNKENIHIFDRMMQALMIVRSNKMVITSDLVGAFGMSRRTAQRYMLQLEQLGYVRSLPSEFGYEKRYFLSEKSKQLFGGAA
ncbi:winged helix-turn-helix domain-containing protein [Acinetobacter towneri]|uniref:Winged helix-turn-helix domain-containing protein n=1 Tax=Acinetobacter towneri TaxID=202956 RepID=A0ABX7THQ7_9GAMM|nr:winged helix-turn-helix domain-containing protein [Acinetobacter towneri]QTD62681.1 winged helix-turn-helix domain-containing protein [Acinetobacter towneri]